MKQLNLVHIFIPEIEKNNVLNKTHQHLEF